MRLSIAVLFVAPFLAAPLAGADESERVEQLEAEVRSLKGQVADLMRLVDDLVEERHGAGAVAAAQGYHSLSEGPQLPSLSIGGFADVNYQVESFRPDGPDNDDVKNAFSLGDLDIFLTSQLSDRVSFLAEILFEFEEQGVNVIDVERLLLKYEYADWLNAVVGRGHTPVGYYNTHFHHGAWLRTTVERPLLFEFEDEGGILPLHFVGLELTGRTLDTEFATIGYNALVSNGRGRTLEAIQLSGDINDNKLWGFRLDVQPSGLEGLNLGASVIGDTIPSDPTVPGREGSIDELIAGGYLVYLEDPIELLVEGQMIRHHDDELHRTFYSSGGYAQLAYRYRKLKPYYRFDLLRINGNDPFYAERPQIQDTSQHTFGLRWDWATFAALKLEYRHRLSKDFDSDLGVGQVSFTF